MILRLFILGMCLLLVVSPVAADVIALKDGRIFRGLLSNRDELAVTPALFSGVSILVDGEGGDEPELQRFPTGKVDYVLLEEGYDRMVIDFSNLARTPQRTPQSRPAVRQRDPHDGSSAGLVLLGAVVAGVGGFRKFGDEKATVTSSSIDYEEKSYNKVNYGMMIGGGALFLLGIAGMASEGHDEVSTVHGNGPSVVLVVSGDHLGLRVTTTF